MIILQKLNQTLKVKRLFKLDGSVM